MKARKPISINTLYNNYIHSDMQKPYINIGDIVLVQSEQYLKEQGCTNERVLNHAEYLLTVVQVYKVDDDLYQYTCMGADKDDLILIDDEIKTVYPTEVVDTENN